MAENPTWSVPLDLVQSIEIELDGVRYRSSVRRGEIAVNGAAARIAKNWINGDEVVMRIGASVHLYLRGESVPANELDHSFAAALLISAVAGHPRVHQAGKAPRFVWSDHIALGRGEDPERASRYSQHVHEPVADHVKRMRGQITVHVRVGDAPVRTPRTEVSGDATVDPNTPTSLPSEAPEQAREPDEPMVTDTDVEEQFTEWARVRAAGEPHTLTRREHALVLRYKRFLEARGYTVVSKRITIPGEGTFRNDLFVVEANALVEAKDEPSREKIRTAIGQILDYRRHVQPEPVCGLLVSRRPSPDLEKLLRTIGVSIVWEADGGFADNTDNASLTA